MACGTACTESIDNATRGCRDLDRDVGKENSLCPLVMGSHRSETGISIPGDPSSMPVSQLPESEPVWPSASRGPPNLRPLSFPEMPRKDLSLFTDTAKDRPIYCFVCDQIFGSTGDHELDTSGQSVVPPHVHAPETNSSLASFSKLSTKESQQHDVRKSDTETKVDSKEEAYSGQREERVREKKDVHPSLQAKDEWLRHMLLEHKIVVHRVSDICSLKW